MYLYVLQKSDSSDIFNYKVKTNYISSQNSSYIDKENWSGVDGAIKPGHSYVAMALLVCWLMVSAVTLVNLLIAMFSDTYRCIKDNQVNILDYLLL